ncbi:MAG: type I restriction-modification system subunit M [Deltaproteobacteria bacterium]|nr:type I restriction-modification system subunit M [Deltaproteobacteria bacterium]
MTPSAAIVQKLWNYCGILLNAGVSYGDYVEQLTYLLFLKMADEKASLPTTKRISIPKGFDWKSIKSLEGDALEIQYRHILETLGKSKGTLSIIFKRAQNKIQDPAKLRRLIALIDSETWLGMDIDIKGDIYEGLLEKNAQDVKGGAGQYFTPRPLIKAIVEVMRPEPGERVCDPACGTGGFFLAHHDYLIKNCGLDKRQLKKLREETYKGYELVPEAARLCMMNMFLHGIESDKDDETLVEVEDALISEPGENKRFPLVLTNPPFGKMGSITITNEEGKDKKETIIYERADFWVTTSNKQINFLQHVRSLLEINGRAAIVVPDNVLFEGGAGETVRKKLLQTCDVHTLLRLPTGIFYAQGVKANVLFFDKKEAREKPWTNKLWLYDFRTNMHFTLKENSLKVEALSDFIKCYNPKDRFKRKESERFKAFKYDELIARDKVSLDIFWLKDDSIEDAENLPEPDVLARDIAENLRAALAQFDEIKEELEEK